MRRLPFEAVRVRSSTSVVANQLPTGREPLSSGTRKRTFTLLSFEGRGIERPVKKHKPFNLYSNCTSGGEVKSNRSREMVGRKFRRLDSLEESGVVTGNSLRRTHSHRVCECEHGSGKWITASSSAKEENHPQVLEGAVEIDSTKRTESRRAASRKKTSVSFSEAFSDDWTQEHLQEPRKIEKRRSLDELHEPLMSWARKAKRSRCGVRILKTGVDINSTVTAFESTAAALIPRKEALKSSGQSDEFTWQLSLEETREINKGINHVNMADSTRFQSIADTNHKNMDILVPPENYLEKGKKDDHEAIREELDFRKPVDNVVAGKGALSLASDRSQCSHDFQTNFVNGPQLHNRIFDAGRNLNADHDVAVILENQSVTCKSSKALSDSMSMKPSFCGEQGVTKASFGSEEGVMKTSFGRKEGAIESCSEAIPESVADVNVRCTAKREILQDCISVEASLEEVVGRSHEDEVKLSLAEGRRCGLCGGGSDGEPPDCLMPVTANYEEEHASGSDKVYPLYSEWDAFSNETGWLGPLLGPLSDRFGIAGVWVHQECAIWSPEVYFAGVGHMKNVRAALRRGRLLKCSRCGKPGATIGCRIDRCPRTYHLPCGRFEGCFFDHKKFLMACDEHLHLFLPRFPGRGHHRGRLNVERIRFKRIVREWKKTAQKASQLDIEAEEKWLEKAGVDEEFLRRERRRLQRDLGRLAPIMVGGSDGQQFVEGWECIAGLDNVVQCMKEIVIMPLLYPEAFDSLAIVPPRGVLLHGHPGTGKTLAVRALVGALAKGQKQIAYFARKGADCLGKYVGDAERQLRLLFHLAEKHQPSLIFFDEIDGLAPTRSQHQDQTQKSVVSTLLALMDGIKSRGSVVVIGATNQPDALDPALRRPGRFDREVYFPLPCTVDRAAILTLLTRKWPVPPTNDAIALLASHTTGYAGADLQALCAQAAMISLRKSTPIEELLTIAEEKGVDRLPPPPELTVTLMDWAVALEKASPPCSWRSAKAAVNVVPSAPLPRYLVPELLWPMLDIIITLHLDARVTLPPLLEDVVLKLESTLKSGLRGESWMTCLRSLSHCRNSLYRKGLESDLENAFCSTGMILGRGKTRQCILKLPYSGSRFRVMISGDPMSGHSYLAAWILYGFEGFVEMCNLSLATMLQEGGGDVIQGLIQILGNVRNICPCVIYMPQLETWALEPVEGSLEGDQRQVSSSWSVFLQLVNSMPGSLQMAFVAYCDIRKDGIPMEIANFFSSTQRDLEEYPSAVHCLHYDSLSNSGPDGELWLTGSRSLPCSWVQLSSVPEMKVIFSRAASDYGESLSARLLYCINTARRGANIPESPSSPKLGTPHSGRWENGYENGSCNKDNSKKEPLSCNLKSNEIVCDDVNLSSGNLLQGGKRDNERLMGSLERQSAGVLLPQQSLVCVAISMLGYQLLYHSQFRDLRHATSKLSEGPSFCVKSFDKRTSCGSNDGNNSQSDQIEDSLVLQGLVAVGLLAYSGKYLKPKEVAWEVRKVLELLMNRIDLKISRGKDPQQFSHLLSQAASLEDKMFAWAHDLQRCEIAAGVMQQPLESLSPSICRSEDQHCDTAIKECSNREKEPNESSHIQDPLLDNSSKALELAASGTEFLVKHDNIVNGSPSHSFHHKRLAACRANEVPAELQGNSANSRAVGQQLWLRDTAWGCHTKRHLKSCTTKGFWPWKGCPDCLNLVKHRLMKLFIKSWRQRGSVLSLDVADDVIGTCSAVISVALHRSVSILDRKMVDGVFQCSALTHKQVCECKIKHRWEAGISSCVVNKVDISDRRKSKCGVHAAHLAAAHHKISEKPSRFGLVCLCPLLQVISDLS